MSEYPPLRRVLIVGLATMLLLPAVAYADPAGESTAPESVETTVPATTTGADTESLVVEADPTTTPQGELPPVEEVPPAAESEGVAPPDVTSDPVQPALPPTSTDVAPDPVDEPSEPSQTAPDTETTQFDPPLVIPSSPTSAPPASEVAPVQEVAPADTPAEAETSALEAFSFSAAAADAQNSAGLVQQQDGVDYTNSSDDPVVVYYSLGDGEDIQSTTVTPGETVSLPACGQGATCRYVVGAPDPGPNALAVLAVTNSTPEPTGPQTSSQVLNTGNGYGSEFAPTDTGVRYTNTTDHLVTVYYQPTSDSDLQQQTLAPGESIDLPACGQGCSYAVYNGDLAADPDNPSLRSVVTNVDGLRYSNFDIGTGAEFVTTDAGVSYTNTSDNDQWVTYATAEGTSSVVRLRPGESVLLPTCPPTSTSCAYVASTGNPFSNPGTFVATTTVTRTFGEPGEDDDPTTPTQPPTTPTTPTTPPTTPPGPNPGGPSVPGACDNQLQRDYLGLLPVYGSFFSGYSLGCYINDLGSPDPTVRTDAVISLVSSAASAVPVIGKPLSAAIDTWAYVGRQAAATDWRSVGSTISYAARNPGVVVRETVRATGRVLADLIPSLWPF